MFRFFLLIFIFPFLAVAAQTASEKHISDNDLLSIAQKELEIPVKNQNAMPLVSSESGLVSTAEALRAEENDIYASSEMEIGFQSYQPVVGEKIRNTKEYLLGRLPSHTMLVLGMHKWFVSSTLKSSVPWRTGLGLEGAFSSSQTSLTTSSKKTYDNVRFHSVLLSGGPEVEFFLFRYLGLGLSAKVGQVFSVQSTPIAALNKSEDASFWAASAHFRVQPVKSVFGKISFSRKNSLGDQTGLGVQENNIVASLGFGM